MTLNERVASLETRADASKEDAADLRRKMDTIDQKLDTLIELKHKGVGAFWLASGLFGTGIISFFYAMVEWIKGIH